MPDPITEPVTETIEVIVRGKVQQVGFRDAAVRHAHLYAVNGWVRNAPDGSVELLLQGPINQIDEFLSWLHRGPEQARVDSVDTFMSQDERIYQHFQLR